MSQTIAVSTAYVVPDFVSGRCVRLWAKAEPVPLRNEDEVLELALWYESIGDQERAAKALEVYCQRSR